MIVQLKVKGLIVVLEKVNSSRGVVYIIQIRSYYTNRDNSPN